MKNMNKESNKETVKILKALAVLVFGTAASVAASRFAGIGIATTMEQILDEK